MRASEPAGEILSRSATGAKSKDLLDRHERSREPDDQRELPAEILTLSLSKGKDVANDQFFLDHFYSLFAQPQSRATRRAGVTLCTTVMLLECLSVCDIIRSLLSRATSRSCFESGGLWRQQRQKNARMKKL